MQTTLTNDRELDVIYDEYSDGKQSIFSGFNRYIRLK